MRSIRLSLLVFLLSCSTVPMLRAQTERPQTASAAIRRVLTDQVAAWNRGDIGTFMQGYKDAADTTFVGKNAEHGYRMILERYQRQFPNKAAMGTLAFTDLEIRPLDAHYAVATGHFHLDRAAGAGGPAGGVFSLVFEDTGAGWKIILDHTS